jgi:hypothetical protein
MQLQRVINTPMRVAAFGTLSLVVFDLVVLPTHSVDYFTLLLSLSWVVTVLLRWKLARRL